MTIEKLECFWDEAINNLLDHKLDGTLLSVLAKQTYDSIRRIKIYETYSLRASQAVEKKRPFFETSNPFVLAQRADLSLEDKIWLLYLATYFGKSRASGWNLFLRAAFDGNKELITFGKIRKDKDKYFRYLESLNFFENSNFSNHRKFTKKSLFGEKGLFRSMCYVIDHIDQFCIRQNIDFQEMYIMAKKIPNFGRLASFDFSSSLVKCGLKVGEPKSMYANHSTGPLKGLGFLLSLAGKDTTEPSKIELSTYLVEWFSKNSDIFMVGQVLEDAICNWQKNPKKHIQYRG